MLPIPSTLPDEPDLAPICHRGVRPPGPPAAGSRSDTVVGDAPRPARRRRRARPGRARRRRLPAAAAQAAAAAPDRRRVDAAAAAARRPRSAAPATAPAAGAVGAACHCRGLPERHVRGPGLRRGRRAGAWPSAGICTMDVAPFCGCDGKDFGASSSCPGRRYAHRGSCGGGAPRPAAACSGGPRRAQRRAAAAPVRPTPPHRSVAGASGMCEGQGCGAGAPGRCAAARRACTKDLRPYCGCDGKTFRSSGSCPGRRFAHPGACAAGAGPGSGAAHRRLRPGRRQRVHRRRAVRERRVRGPGLRGAGPGRCARARRICARNTARSLRLRRQDVLRLEHVPGSAATPTPARASAPAALAAVRLLRGGASGLP